ncbi:hypothetical protein BGY98DRAFT_1049078 [Russula aff. rugulosa BPL654]|nr:hypothetical protein BGY98DRAFT_1049078 [Russula aff. rugulosa BPL654]
MLFIFHAFAISISITPYPSIFTPNSTNNSKPIFTVMCTCAPLPSTHVLALTLTFILFTLLLTPSPLLTD